MDPQAEKIVDQWGKDAELKGAKIPYGSTPRLMGGHHPALPACGSSPPRPSTRLMGGQRPYIDMYEDFLREGRKPFVKPSKYDTSALPAGVQSGIKTSSRSSENSLIPAEIKSTGNMVALVIPQSSFDDIYKISKKRTS